MINLGRIVNNNDSTSTSNIFAPRSDVYIPIARKKRKTDNKKNNNNQTKLDSFLINKNESKNYYEILSDYDDEDDKDHDDNMHVDCENYVNYADNNKKSDNMLVDKSNSINASDSLHKKDINYESNNTKSDNILVH